MILSRLWWSWVIKTTTDSDPPRGLNLLFWFSRLCQAADEVTDHNQEVLNISTADAKTQTRPQRSYAVDQWLHHQVLSIQNHLSKHADRSASHEYFIKQPLGLLSQ